MRLYKKLIANRDTFDRGAFMSKVNTKAQNGCWEWTAGKFTAGYGAFYIYPGTCYAHRVSYEAFIGDIPPGMQLDHLCRNKACVNPDHLEPVTASENVLRGLGSIGLIHKCRRGHEAQWHTSGSGKRTCILCRRERDKKYYRRKVVANSV